MEVQTYMKDGQVDNWDLFEKMLDYCYAKVSIYFYIFSFIEVKHHIDKHL